jgi:Fe-S cluster biogenesis protein NfuA/nitrite reductase/ring-hydroxylating ferredoxin subunit
MLAFVGRQPDEVAARILEAFANDALIAHLLLLHDLHPVDVETRVRRALEEVRPYLQSHGGNVELLAVEEGVARLRLQGSCSGCPSSTMTLKLAIEEAIQKAAPDLDRIEAEGVTAPPRAPVAFVPASDLLRGPAAVPGWTVVDRMPQLADGETAIVQVAEVPLLFCRLEGTFYAYRSACPGCARSLDEAQLTGAELTCPGCSRGFDVRRAGRCLDEPDQQLEPVPLLTRDGIVRVALNR